MSKPRTTPSPTPVSAEDRALFRDSVGSVRRLAEAPPPPRRPPPPPRAHIRARDEAAVLDELLDEPDPRSMETGAELGWVRADLPPGLLRKLRRGQFSIDDEIDLHHLTAAAARSLLLEFLADALAEDYRCVRIVHGKGRRSGPRGPVLNGLTDQLLRRHKAVLAFASAPAAEGGTGAVLVLLRQPTGRR